MTLAKFMNREINHHSQINALRNITGTQSWHKQRRNILKIVHLNINRSFIHQLQTIKTIIIAIYKFNHAKMNSAIGEI